MLPYFNISTFHLGPLTIYTWGFVVSLGFAVAIWVAYRRARRTGLEGGKVLDLAFWILVAAFMGARLFHVFFYEWHYYSMHLKEIVRIDQGGLSSFGGFIGAVVAFLVYGRRKLSNAPQPPLKLRGGVGGVMLRYADLLMFVWPLGHGIGRLGCFLVHMHPGRLSIVPWAVQYPGGSRLDMGLIEALYHFLIFGVVLFFSRKSRPTGFYVILTMTLYSIARFAFDFFRAADLPISDARYLGLTPAQYGSFFLLMGGIYLLYRKSYAWKSSRS